MKEKQSDLIGGQALSNGVLFRTKHWVSIAKRQGDLIENHLYQTRPLQGWQKFLSQVPLLRGPWAILSIFFSFAKNFFQLTRERHSWITLLKKLFFVLIVFVIFSILLQFFLLPLAYYETQVPFFQSPSYFSLVLEQVLLYVFLIVIVSILVRLFKPQLFAYHGAEHKALATYEQGKRLVVSEAQKSSRLHPRCGTTFFALVLLVDSFLLTPLLYYCQIAYTSFWQLVALSIAYECNRYLQANRTVLVARGIFFFGSLLQLLTTTEPNDQQMAVALAALDSLPKESV